MAERKRNYELVVALSPVATETEASEIVDNISELFNDKISTVITMLPS